MTEAKTLLENVEWCQGAYEAIEGADALTLLTEWNEFRALDLDRVRGLMQAPLIVDLVRHPFPHLQQQELP